MSGFTNLAVYHKFLIQGESMKKVSSLLCTLLLMGVASFGQTLTQADRDKGIKYLEQTRRDCHGYHGTVGWSDEVQAGSRPLVGGGDARTHCLGGRFSFSEHDWQNHEIAGGSSRPRHRKS